MVTKSLSLLCTFSFFSFLGLASLSFAAISPSSVASSQLQFWSENVHGIMPKVLLSKLSPLSKHDSHSIASLISNRSFSSDAHFCSLANLYCSSRFASSQIASQIYKIYSAAKMTLGSEQVDPNNFFRLSILKEGNQVQLPDSKDKYPPRGFLPSEIASSISLNLDDLQNIFPESFASQEAKATIHTTLLYCDAPALKGEIKICAKSLEEMVEFSKKVLGKKQLSALTSASAHGAGRKLVIGNIKLFPAEKFVSCHEVYLPFVTYFCHLLSSTRLYAVDIIEPETRAPVNRIIATCHMDTSAWPANHVAFKILKSSPGQTEACHWFWLTNTDLIWIGNESV